MHFSHAAAPRRQGPDLSAFRGARVPAEFANDNPAPRSAEPVPDALLEAALRHFAAHGLGAARAAREQAEAAFFAGERERYDWWLSLTRILDRRMASELAKGRDLAG